MSEARNNGIAFLLNGRKNFAKLTVMEAPNVTPSFLCFLPELQCAPANIVYINGITETSGIQQISGKAISLPINNKKISHEKIDIDNRLLSSSMEAKLSFNNGFTQRIASLSGNICPEDISGRGVCEPLETATRTEGSLSPVGMVEKGVQVEVLDLEAGAVSQTSENRVLLNDKVSKCNGNHVLVEDFIGETDVLAFEITEFFDAFRDGQEHKLLKYTKNSDLSSPESLLQPEGDQWGARSNLTLNNQHPMFDKESTPVDVDHIGGRISSSASRSGKWNGFLEADQFSGPLTFSGSLSVIGNSGHGLYSGSVSHRSDSSTASTHSFAFPILPYDWNSSPVKMAQPDKRFMQRPWKRRLRSFFCCDSFK